MITVGIIGTAFRREDKNKLTKEIYEFMYQSVLGIIEELDISYDLVSGGASGADQLAVRLFLNKYGNKLTLHLPCSFFVDGWSFWNENIKDFKHPANILNYYHGLFIKKTGFHSTQEIAQAISLGAGFTINKGFLARNERIAQDAMVLIALTFGNGAVLKNGGTAHCMSYFQSLKGNKNTYHINLNDMKIYSPALVNKVDSKIKTL